MSDSQHSALSTQDFDPDAPPLICLGGYSNHRYLGTDRCLRCGKKRPRDYGADGRYAQGPRQKLIDKVHLSARNDPLAAGYDARISGLTLRACPFKPGKVSPDEPESRDLWLQGWTDADFELSRGTRARDLAISRR